MMRLGFGVRFNDVKVISFKCAGLQIWLDFFYEKEPFY